MGLVVFLLGTLNYSLRHGVLVPSFTRCISTFPYTAFLRKGTVRLGNKKERPRHYHKKEEKKSTEEAKSTEKEGTVGVALLLEVRYIRNDRGTRRDRECA